MRALLPTLALLAPCTALAQSAAPPAGTELHCGQLFDARSGRLLGPHTVSVREVRLAAGAGFVVVICGEIMTMPGLPREPSALRIGLDGQGQVQGLF